tara:strand:- start:6028 stop:6510 length:483 start_codon:yes stop_codon:yes gene_type:complete
MIILGIDPGLIQTGFGVIDINNDIPLLVDYGVVKPIQKDPLALRLLTIYKDVVEIINKYHPIVCAIEDVFYGKNIKSTLLLGQARGAAMVAAGSRDISIFEYSARKVKQSITGNGNAHKEQVQFMVKAKLKLNSLPEPMDAADALAIALCHNHQFRIGDI